MEMHNIQLLKEKDHKRYKLKEFYKNIKTKEGNKINT